MHGYQVHIGPMYADTRGYVRVRSTNPMEHPAIQFNYLLIETDRKEWVEVVRAARAILAQPAFAAFNGGEESYPGRVCRLTRRFLDCAKGRRDRVAPIVLGQDGYRRAGQS